MEDCRKLAADRGWPVGAEYVDNDLSAFSGKPRREYARMLTNLSSGARDAVIVYNLDRLHRLPAELEDFVALCERFGVSQVGCHAAAQRNGEASPQFRCVPVEQHMPGLVIAFSA